MPVEYTAHMRSSWLVLGQSSSMVKQESAAMAVCTIQPPDVPTCALSIANRG